MSNVSEDKNEHTETEGKTATVTAGHGRDRTEGTDPLPISVRSIAPNGGATVRCEMVKW